MSAQQQHTVVVTSAEGATARAVIKHLTETGSAHVIACPVDSTSYKLDETSKSGATVCKHGSDDHASCVESFRDADCAVVIPPATEDMLTQTRKIFEAVKAARVKFVVLVSMIGSQEEHSQDGLDSLEAFRRCEQMLSDSTGMPHYCIVRCSLYSEILLHYKEQVLQGFLPLPIGQNKIAPVAIDDIGKSVAEIAMHPDKYQDKTLNLYGAESRTGEELAKIASLVLGYEIRYQPITDAEAFQILSSDPEMTGPVIELVREQYMIANKGQLADKPTDLTKLVSKPCSVEMLFEANKQMLLVQ